MEAMKVCWFCKAWLWPSEKTCRRCNYRQRRAA